MNNEQMRDGEMQDMVGRTFRHFKGGIYTVLGFTTDSETLEPTVIYRNVNTKQVWNRPLSNFTEKVEVNDSVVDRFQKLDIPK